MKVVGNRPEGRGVLAKREIQSGTVVCNYGGAYLTKAEADLVEDRDYLLEMNGSKKFFLYHSKHSYFAFGKYINHSSLHPNLRPQVFERDSLKDVLFVANKKILPGQELCYDYGTEYKGVHKCIASCDKCSK
jgi:SET domain-containing protein